jgi:hypothetical protein
MKPAGRKHFYLLVFSGLLLKELLQMLAIIVTEVFDLTP